MKKKIIISISILIAVLIIIAIGYFVMQKVNSVVTNLMDKKIFI